MLFVVLSNEKKSMSLLYITCICLDHSLSCKLVTISNDCCPMPYLLTQVTNVFNQINRTAVTLIQDPLTLVEYPKYSDFVVVRFNIILSFLYCGLFIVICFSTHFLRLHCQCVIDLRFYYLFGTAFF